MGFVFRQNKPVADVLQGSDDDDNGNYYFLFSEGEARRSLRSELNAVRGRAMHTRWRAMRTLQVQKHVPWTFGISTWNLS
jgi:hypothetical protein